MKELLYSKNIRNTAWHVADTFLYPVLFFVTSPWFIDRLGESQFGIWILVNSIIIMMQLFNLGLGAATFKNVAVHTGVKNYGNVIKTLNTNLSLSSVLHILSISAGALIAMGIKYFSLFKIDETYVSLAATGALFGGFIVGLKFYEQLISFTFKALERYDVAAWLNSGIKLTSLFINIVLVYLGYDLITLFISTIMVSLGGIFTGYLLIKKHIPGYVPSFHFDKNNISKELNFAIWPWMQSLAIVITFQCDRFFVLTYLGLSTLTYYGIIATMFNHIHMGFSAIVPWLAPKVTKLKTQGQNAEELYMTSRNLCLLVALSLLLLFSMINEPLLKMFLGSDKFNHTAVFIKMFTLFELFFVYSIVPAYYLNAGGHEKLNFWIVLFYCTVIIIGMLTGYYLYRSATGILAGLITATAFSVFVQHLIINKRVFGERSWLSTFILFSPALMISVFILSGDVLFKSIFFLLSIVSLYLVFFRQNSINLNLIKYG